MTSLTYPKIAHACANRISKLSNYLFRKIFLLIVPRIPIVYFIFPYLDTHFRGFFTYPNILLFVLFSSNKQSQFFFTTFSTRIKRNSKNPTTFLSTKWKILIRRKIKSQTKNLLKERIKTCEFSLSSFFLPIFFAEEKLRVIVKAIKEKGKKEKIVIIVLWENLFEHVFRFFLFCWVF